jgi:hypothetical protein
VPRDAINAIHDPHLVPVDRPGTDPSEMVMAVEINGESRAYSIVVHDRRLRGETLAFGVQGALYMNNMTWYDRQTGSIWIQMWGEAVAGPLIGETLMQLPAYVGPLGTWVAQHPDSLFMNDGPGMMGFYPDIPHDDFVFGITHDAFASAYCFRPAAEAGILNDSVGEVPVLVYVDPDSRDIRVFDRRIDSQVSTFQMSDGELRDFETGTRWNPVNGLSLTGELAHEVLNQIPFTTAFDWSWRDLYPDSSFYPEYAGRSS